MMRQAIISRRGRALPRPQRRRPARHDPRGLPRPHRRATRRAARRSPSSTSRTPTSATTARCCARSARPPSRCGSRAARARRRSSPTTSTCSTSATASTACRRRRSTTSASTVKDLDLDEATGAARPAAGAGPRVDARRHRPGAVGVEPGARLRARRGCASSTRSTAWWSTATSPPSRPATPSRGARRSCRCRSRRPSRRDRAGVRRPGQVAAAGEVRQRRGRAVPRRPAGHDDARHRPAGGGHPGGARGAARPRRPAGGGRRDRHPQRRRQGDDHAAPAAAGRAARRHRQRAGRRLRPRRLQPRDRRPPLDRLDHQAVHARGGAGEGAVAGHPARRPGLQPHPGPQPARRDLQPRATRRARAPAGWAHHAAPRAAGLGQHRLRPAGHRGRPRAHQGRHARVRRRRAGGRVLHRT